MRSTEIVYNLLEADLDDPAIALKSIVGGIKTGQVTLPSGVVVTRVRSRDGKYTGVPTGGMRRCGDGCRGTRFGVRWSDGKLTWICSRGCSIDNETAILD